MPDQCSNPCIGAGQQAARWGQTTLLHRGIHTFLLGCTSPQWLLTRDMHRSSRSCWLWFPLQPTPEPSPWSRVLLRAVPALLAEHLQKAYGAPWVCADNWRMCSHTCVTHPHTLLQCPPTATSAMWPALGAAGFHNHSLFRSHPCKPRCSWSGFHLLPRYR